MCGDCRRPAKGQREAAVLSQPCTQADSNLAPSSRKQPAQMRSAVTLPDSPHSQSERSLLL